MKFRTQTTFLAALMAALLSSCSSDSSSSAKEEKFDASVVCPAEGVNAYGEPNRGTFIDARNGNEYKYVTIGTQVWMAENLDLETSYSSCYNNDEEFCAQFGRHYSLLLEGKDLGIFDQTVLDTVCPSGWHVPSVTEWDILANSMGGRAEGAIRLINSDSLNDELYVPGTDDCGFNSLPAGYMQNNLGLEQLWEKSFYWTSTSKDLNIAYMMADLSR